MLNTEDTKKQTIPEKVAEPQSSPAGKRAAREILLLGIRAEVDLKNRERLAWALAGNVDWEHLIFLAEYHGVAPLLAYNLAQDEIKSYVPEPYSERFRQIYQNNVFRNMFLSDELVKVLSVFHQHGIEVITLKGIVLAEQLYVNPILRTSHDIDILVQPDKIIQASTLLKKMDYSESTLPEELDHPFHRIYNKKVNFPFIVEVHWDLNDPKLEAVNREEIWRRARHYQFQGGTTMVLSPEDILIYISTSLLKQDGEYFKHLSDITELLKKNQDSIDWDYIIETGHSLGITTSIYYTLKWAQVLLGAPVPEPAIMMLKPSLPKRCLISWLVDHKTLLSPASWMKLRNEITTLARSLMMSRILQSFTVLARYRGYNKRAVWLRTVAWIPLVLGAGLWLNVVKFYKFRMQDGY